MTDKSATLLLASDMSEPDAIDELPLPYIEMDGNGFVTRANRAALALYPAGHGEPIGKMAWDLMPTDEKEPSCAEYISLMESGEEPPIVHRTLYSRLGQFRTYELHRRLIRDGAGRPAGMRILFVDVTESEKALEDARWTRLWLESVIEAIGDAVIVTDAMGIIRYANPAAEALLGWKASELEGMVIEQGLPILAYVSGFRLELTFTMSLDGPSKGVATVLDRERRELQIELGTSPIFDKESGATTGVVLILHQPGLED
jgi:PAS domain S-box-containing protein